MFQGSITAMITPFKDGEIDWKAFDHLVEWQIAQGTHGLVPCGTTGESPTVSHDEHNAIIKRCVDVVKGRIPVLAGTGSNSTKEAVDLTIMAKEAGADGALSVVPYYNKPSQEGMYEHFKAVENVGLPIVLYNIPGRSVVALENDTIARLAELDNIVGIKDATGDLARPVDLRRLVGNDFLQLSGCDESVAGFLAQGGHGVISVVSNIAPKESATLVEARQNGDIATFSKLRDQLNFLSVELFCESSPAPVKYAASKMGLCTDQVRLPILPASAGARARVDAAMKHAEIGQAA
ncbi:MAG: 4-hydroxy-tetrahydrodipicolinate synthase [Micavibrio sp.]|nr:4-hydroxy-tetrahydrodipicolinate synthase [Micavibrio sp.]